MSKYECPHCAAENEFDDYSLRMSPIKRVFCMACRKDFKATKPKKGRSDAQRRSKDQEKRAARRYGGKVQAGSGTSSRAKGDFVDSGVLRGECKETTRKSFSLKVEELMKIEKEARGDELPLFEVEFQGVFPRRTYAIVPASQYQALRDEVAHLRELVEGLEE